MGVDWYTCNHCEGTFSDAGHYGQCSNCEDSYCGDCYDEFIEKYGTIDKTHERYSMYGSSLIECDHCNGTEVSESELLTHALMKLNISRDELKEEYVKLHYAK
ncbi:hypothetical protein BC351_01175 [Paenibacillus ferrarius]|uniref:Uncharacterized protein n=1 Tax=Paenibacillus ferrarius TaxID=1469647 RepID=A0A1V4HTN9_9BACL|nr:hypothetical protein [Paenibacillus ferrarius]OPH61883.1 hypothetical protein BC351_01175 [Paenibacillus ferrarius]